MFSRHVKSTNQFFKWCRDVPPISSHSPRWYYTLKTNYDHNNLLIFSRFHHLLTLTLVRHQCAEMEVSGQLMGHFHRADTLSPFNHPVLVIFTICIAIKPETKENTSPSNCVSISISLRDTCVRYIFNTFHFIACCLPYNSLLMWNPYHAVGDSAVKRYNFSVLLQLPFVLWIQH